MPLSTAAGRRIFRATALFLVTVTVLGALLYAALPWLAAHMLPSVAAAYGVELHELTVARPGLRTLTVHRVAATRGRLHIQARDGRLTYDLASLLSGRVHSLTFRQATLEVRSADPAGATAAHPAGAQPSPAPPAVVTPPPPVSPPSFVSPPPFVSPQALFDAVPADRVEVAELTVAVPEVEFRASGRLGLAAQTLALHVRALAPARAEPFSLDLQASRDGRIMLQLAERDVGSAPLLDLSSVLDGNRLNLHGTVDLRGFPLTLATALTGVPAGDGVVTGQFTGWLPWPLPEALDWHAGNLTGTVQVDWQPTEQPWAIRGAAARWQLADGELSGDLQTWLDLAARTWLIRVPRMRVDPAAGHSLGQLTVADDERSEPYLSLDWSLAPSSLSLDGRATLRDGALALAQARGLLPPGAGELRSSFALTLPWPLPEILTADGEGAMDGHWRDDSSDLGVRDLAGTWRLRGRSLSGKARAQLSYRGLGTELAATLDQARLEDTMAAAGSVRLGALAPLDVWFRRSGDGAASLQVRGTLEVREPLAGATLHGWSEPFDVTAGKLGLDADLRLPAGGGVSGRVRADLDGVAAYYDEYLVEGLTTTLNLASGSSGWSLAPTPVQVQRLATGVDLENVTTGLSWSGDVLSLQPARADLLGGTVQVRAFDYRLASGAGTTTVELTDVDLAQLLALEGEQISGSGSLDGVIPLTLTEGAPSVTGGKVRADPPGGVVRVSPALAGDTGQPGLDFALRALRDFRYQVLEAEVDYTTEGDLTLGVHLQGRNPEIEAGRPIHYNVTVTENVPTLLEALRLQRRLTRGIERRMHN